MGFRYLVSLLSAIQATEFLILTLAELTPAEHTSLSWTHNRTSGFPIHPAPRSTIQYASVLRYGFRSLRTLGLGQPTQANAWLKVDQVYALR